MTIHPVVVKITTNVNLMVALVEINRIHPLMNTHIVHDLMSIIAVFVGILLSLDQSGGPTIAFSHDLNSQERCQINKYIGLNISSSKGGQLQICHNMAIGAHGTQSAKALNNYHHYEILLTIEKIKWPLTPGMKAFGIIQRCNTCGKFRLLSFPRELNREEGQWGDLLWTITESTSTTEILKLPLQQACLSCEHWHLLSLFVSLCVCVCVGDRGKCMSLCKTRCQYRTHGKHFPFRSNCW